MSSMADHYVSAIRSTDLVRRVGHVSQFFGLVVESVGPDAFLGEICEIYPRSQAAPISAEVVGFKDGKVLLMPYGDLHGIGLGSEVLASGRYPSISIGDQLLGRVIDAFGRPLDGKYLRAGEDHYHLKTEPQNPLTRTRIQEVLETRIKAIDTMLTVGKGQRMGIFSGSGVGKSTLIGMIARNVEADVIVIALIGERGREVLDFIDKNLGKDGLKKSIVLVATSDQPALVRSRAAFAATAIAEYFRDKKKDVVLIMDSITRLAMAQREIGLAIGEPPTSRGYTPSVFAALPKLLERCGTAVDKGSITAFYTVLVEGDDPNDPISDAMRAVLDGHVVMSRELANKGHYPAINILASKSRLMSDLANKRENELARDAIAILSTYENAKDMVDIGAYRANINMEIDRAVELAPRIQKFLCQDSTDEGPQRALAVEALTSLLG